MGRQILKGQYVVGWQTDDGIRITPADQLMKSLQDRNVILHRAVVGNDENQRPVSGALEQSQQQRFGRRRESGHTNTARVRSKVGGYTREGGKGFDVRKKFADERQNHCSLSLSGLEGRGGASSAFSARSAVNNLQKNASNFRGKNLITHG